MNAKVICEGPSSNGTRVVLENGGELQGLTRVTFIAEVGGVNRIEADILCSAIEADGVLTVYANHPETGVCSKVDKITFADGTEWAAEG